MKSKGNWTQFELAGCSSYRGSTVHIFRQYYNSVYVPYVKPVKQITLLCHSFHSFSFYQKKEVLIEQTRFLSIRILNNSEANS